LTFAFIGFDEANIGNLEDLIEIFEDLFTAMKCLLVDILEEESSANLKLLELRD
jgi:hypothetical protein